MDCVQTSSQFYEEECEEAEDTHFDFRDPVPQLQHEKTWSSKGCEEDFHHHNSPDSALVQTYMTF